ncbi:hypothetical protein PGT21_025925 [Puccinia graminis f. sp. tritici]|uniref:Uncharacterized protein n=2 Tax=Puccinia graminis f. sp. tritici TaxID=56615 RepID=E3KU08_PUCGT|nr:uncharacterized protein PGTG_13489 [Puccinia graminis f. sp. tritici CRL 75-36-700-3]EFP87703.1 hypothetical protein PGTG_13489 [Puccinia graminis f. sp. tritici CRL 75-36-700-3]KAA1101613.1 hypothetical protein PGT21_025925 [Puccinia graminis f. sp. tritici]KAA1136354.1 hypothetical protein PGTUg99_027258 [Puccinia graminis f. sp. tritici]
MYAKKSTFFQLFRVSTLAIIHSAIGAIFTSPVFDDITTLKRISSKWKLTSTQSEETTGFGKQFLDEHGELCFLYNTHVQLTARVVDIYPRQDVIPTREDLEKQIDRPNQPHQNPPVFSLPALQVFNPIRGSVVQLAIIDMKNGMKIEDQKIRGTLPAKYYELPEGYDPRRILFSVDAITDHCLGSLMKSQPTKPEFPSHSSLLTSDTIGFDENAPDSIIQHFNIFGLIWNCGWSWIKKTMDFINSPASPDA